MDRSIPRALWTDECPGNACQDSKEGSDDLGDLFATSRIRSVTPPGFRRTGSFCRIGSERCVSTA